MGYLLGVDVGSSSIKSVVFDEKGNVVGSKAVRNTARYSDPRINEWSYLAPEKVEQLVFSSIREAVSNSLCGNRIDGVAVTGMGAEGLPIDSEGKPLFPVIFYDNRTVDSLRTLKKRIGAREYFRVAGKQILPIDTILRIHWVSENFPEIIARTHKWLLLVDYINFKMSGRTTTDPSMASCTGAFDIHKGDWSDNLIREMGLRRGIFPEIIPCGVVIGKVNRSVARATGLKEGTPIVQGGHDFHCARYVVDTMYPDCVTDILGTWEICLSRIRRIETGGATMRSGIALERTVNQNEYTGMLSNVYAGVLEWYLKSIGSGLGRAKSRWRQLEHYAEVAGLGSKGLYFLPHLFGSNSPVIDNRSSAAIIGFRSETGKEEIFRAIVEGLNYQSRDMVESLEKVLKLKKDTVVSAGGVTQNKMIMQNKADILQREILVPEIGEVTAMGAAVIAGTGVGMFKNKIDIKRKIVFKECRYKPNCDESSVYSEKYQIYREIYDALKSLSHKIYDSR